MLDGVGESVRVVVIQKITNVFPRRREKIPASPGEDEGDPIIWPLRPCLCGREGVLVNVCMSACRGLRSSPAARPSPTTTTFVPDPNHQLCPRTTIAACFQTLACNRLQPHQAPAYQHIHQACRQQCWCGCCCSSCHANFNPSLTQQLIDGVRAFDLRLTAKTQVREAGYSHGFLIFSRTKCLCVRE